MTSPIDITVENKKKSDKPRRIIRSQTTTVELEGLLEGFTVTWKRSISVKLMRRLLDISKNLSTEEDTEDLTDEEQQAKSEESVSQMEEIVDIIAPRLVSWDLEDEEGTLSANKSTLLELDIDYLMELLTSFSGVVGELPKVQKSA